MHAKYRLRADRLLAAAAFVFSAWLLAASIALPVDAWPAWFVVGAAGMLGFGTAWIRHQLGSGISRGFRVALCALAALVGAVSVSVLVLPSMLLIALWFFTTAATRGPCIAGRESEHGSLS